MSTKTNAPKMIRRISCTAYRKEKIEAYSVAIRALRMPYGFAALDTAGTARKLRHALANKLDREIQKWVNATP